MTKIEVCIGKDEDDLGSGEYFQVCSTTLDGVYRLLRTVIYRKCLAFLLHSQELMIRELKAIIAGLEKQNSQLIMKVEKLYVANTDSPNKRTKY